MSLTPPGLKNEIRAKFGELIRENSKSICVYSPSLTEGCPNCIEDHTGASTNVYDSGFIAPVTIFDRVITPTPFTRGRCPVCLGKGVLEQEVKSTIKVLVRWNPMSKGTMEKTPGGIEGANVVLIKASKCHYDLIRDCIKAVVDGVECTLYLPPTIRSEGSVDMAVIAYLVATEVGSSTRGV